MVIGFGTTRVIFWLRPENSRGQLPSFYKPSLARERTAHAAAGVRHNTASNVVQFAVRQHDVILCLLLDFAVAFQTFVQRVF
jgi:hypothetical protein